MNQSGIWVVNCILVVMVTNVTSQYLTKTFMGREYMLFTDNRKSTFSGMERLCRIHGAIIAPARTPKENTLLYNMRAQAGMGGFRMWIGGDDRNGTDGVYVWSDGSPLTFTNWIGREPLNAGGKEDCMVMEAEFVSKSGEWNDISCEEFKHSVICMKSEGSSTQVPTLRTTLRPTPLPQATSAPPSSTTQSISQGSTRPSSPNSTMPALCGHDTSFPLGLGVGIVIGLPLGLLLSFLIITIYYCMNKKKKKREVKIVSYDADAGYLVPNVSSSSVTQTQGQSSVEISHYASLGDTLPQAASEYEPLKLYENYNKCRK